MRTSPNPHSTPLKSQQLDFGKSAYNEFHVVNASKQYFYVTCESVISTYIVHIVFRRVRVYVPLR